MPAVSLAVLLALAAAGPAFAQAGSGAGGATGRFVTGPLEWTPTLIVREAGVDSNVFNVSGGDTPQADRYLTFTPQVDTVIRTLLGDISAQGSIQALYYSRFTTQRALNGLVNGRMDFPLTRVRPSVAVQWQRMKDRSGNEIDLRTSATTSGYSGQLAGRLAARSSVMVSAGRQDVAYDAGQIFQGRDVATALNRTSTEVGVAVRFELSPFTQLVVDARGSRDTFTRTPDRQIDNFRATAGFEFAPDAVIRGGASIGYHKMVARGNSGFPFAGLTSAVNLGYSLLGRTRFELRVTRDTTYSVLSGEGYYLSTIGGLEITHNLVGPLDVSARGSREWMDYAATSVSGDRLDLSDAVGGGVSVRLSPSASAGLNYDNSRRRSTLGPAGGFTRHRIYTTLSYGF